VPIKEVHRTPVNSYDRSEWRTDR